jgi:tartrate dehydratase beta subunit/fumarate hydratase class I family protein
MSVRVVRLPRHGASLPIGLGVSCAADRQAVGKITCDGVYLEQLEDNPAQYLPDVDATKFGGEVVQVDLNRGGGVYPELGMEAIWRIEVENFPAFIVIDDKGNDFFKELNLG